MDGSVVLSNQFHGDEHDCTTLEGTSKCHHFKAIPNEIARSNEVYMNLRLMPCSCTSCRTADCDKCRYKHITGDWQVHCKLSIADADKQKLEKLKEDLRKVREMIVSKGTDDFNKFTLEQLNMMIRVCEMKIPSKLNKSQKVVAILAGHYTISGVLSIVENRMQSFD